MRTSLLGSFGALALLVIAAVAWSALGPGRLAIGAVGIGLLVVLAMRRERILEALPASLWQRTTKTPLVLGASLAVGAWLAATVFALVSLPADALPPSGERVAELETNVDGLVAAIGLLGGGAGATHDDGPPLTPAFPVAGAEPAMTATAAPTREAAMTPTEAASPFVFATPLALATATPSAGATPSPLSQPRVTSGPGGGPLDTAGANRYNCTDFDSWEQAVAVFRASGEADPNLLDTDGNGIPCEELKAAELARG